MDTQVQKAILQLQHVDVDGHPQSVSSALVPRLLVWTLMLFDFGDVSVNLVCAQWLQML